METSTADKLDQWFPIGLDSQVQPASSNPVFVNGYALAMWRPEGSQPNGGTVNVWEDRCPHRGMRLSFGFVRDNLLRCNYHGWGYEDNGQCVSIPAHPDLTPPKSICANVYPSEMRYGIVWTNLAEEPSASMPDVADEDGWAPVRSIYVQKSAEDVEKGVKVFDHGTGSEVDTNAGQGVILVRLDNMSLMLAVQPIDSNKAALHVVAKGDAASSSETQVQLAAQMERLRDTIEAY